MVLVLLVGTCRKYRCPLAAIGNGWFGISVFYYWGAHFLPWSHVSSQSITPTFLSGDCYCSTSFHNVPPFHSACLVHVKLSLLSFSFQYSPTPLLAFHSSSITSRLLHLNQIISLASTEITALPSEFLFVAASGSHDICLSPPCSLCTPPWVLHWHIVPILSPSCLFLALLPPGFIVHLPQLCSLDYSPLPAWAPLLLAAAMRYHQDLHSSPLEHVSHQNSTVVPTHSSRWLVCVAGYYWIRLVDALMCYQLCPRDFIRKTYFSHLQPPGVPERMWSVNFDAWIVGEYRTPGAHSGLPSE